jgi:hypothetical protein
VAGLRPGLGRGGITHSLEVTLPGVPGPGDGETVGLAASAGAKGAAAFGTIVSAGGAAITSNGSVLERKVSSEIGGP